MRAGTAAAITGAAGIALVAIAVALLLLDSEGGPRVPRDSSPDSRETEPLPEESPRPGPEQPPPAVIHPRSTASLAGIEGVIRDDNGELVAGADVAVEELAESPAKQREADPGALVMHATSDATGRFALRDLAPGLYACLVQGAGLGWKSAVVQVEDRRMTAVTFVAAVRPETTGQVVDPYGKPVEGADVRISLVRRTPGRTGKTVSVLTRTSGVEGWFAFPSAASPVLGTASIEASKRGVGYGILPILGAYGAGTSPILGQVVKLRAVRSLTLRFSRAEGGAAPAGVPFELWGGQYRRSGASDSSGRFTDPDLPSLDGLSLTLHDPRFVLDAAAVRSNWRHFEIERKGDVELVVPLTRAPGVHEEDLWKSTADLVLWAAPGPRVGAPTEVPFVVEVIGTDGRGVPRVNVIVMGDREGDQNVIRQGSTGEDGTVSLPAPLWGRVSVDVDPASLPPGTGLQDGFDPVVPVEDTGRAGMKLRLCPEVSAWGTVVVDDGTSAEGGVIRFAVGDPAYEDRSRFARIGPGGRFHVRLRTWRKLVPAEVTRAAGPLDRAGFVPVDPEPLVAGKVNFVPVRKNP